MFGILKYVFGFWLVRKIVSLFSDDGPKGPFVCYYGCPNSGRAEKLQLARARYRRDD